MQNYHPPVDLLKDRVILVTGAGQGLGKTAALAFARHGATVILHGRTIAKLESTYDEIMEQGGMEPAILPLDYNLTNETELQNFAQAIETGLTRLDGIFHGASHFSPLTPLANQGLDTWLTHLRVNIGVPAALTRACFPLLKKSPQASVIFLTETHALEPQAYWGAFAVCKSALTTLNHIWASELGTTPQVRINLCWPGPVASPLRARSHPGESPAHLPAAESLAPHFLYLMGPDSAHLNGERYQCK